MAAQKEAQDNARKSAGLFVFSGDPIHYGHLNIINRAAGIFRELIVGIGVNPEKKHCFTLEERLAMARACTRHLPNVRVVDVPGLTVDYAYEHGLVIIKGVRDAADFNYELLLHEIGSSQQLGVDTLLLPTTRGLAHMSSAAAKELQKHHGLVHEYVPLIVKEMLEERISGQQLIGVTGDIGSGKTTLCRDLVAIGAAEGTPIHHVDVDDIAHEILCSREEPRYAAVRKEIAERFGDVLDAAGMIKTKPLGDIAFGDPEALKRLNALMYIPLLVRLRQELNGKRGIVLIDAALLAEADMGYIVNNNIILLSTDEASQRRRLGERGYSREQLERRLGSQYREPEKRALFAAAIERSGHGTLWRYENSDGAEIARKAYDDIVKYCGRQEAC